MLKFFFVCWLYFLMFFVPFSLNWFAFSRFVEKLYIFWVQAIVGYIYYNYLPVCLLILLIAFSPYRQEGEGWWTEASNVNVIQCNILYDQCLWYLSKEISSHTMVMKVVSYVILFFGYFIVLDSHIGLKPIYNLFFHII